MIITLCVLIQAQSSNDVAFQLDPPPINTTITYTSASGHTGNAVFVPDSSYQLMDTVENDVYTFTVTVTNAAGPSSEVSAKIEGKINLLSCGFLLALPIYSYSFCH